MADIYQQCRPDIIHSLAIGMDDHIISAIVYALSDSLRIETVSVRGLRRPHATAIPGRALIDTAPPPAAAQARASPSRTRTPSWRELSRYHQPPAVTRKLALAVPSQVLTRTVTVTVTPTRLRRVVLRGRPHTACGRRRRLRLSLRLRAAAAARAAAADPQSDGHRHLAAGTPSRRAGVGDGGSSEP